MVVSEADSAATAARTTLPSAELRCLETVLNSLDALIYVADLQTCELLFVNLFGRKVWGEPSGRKCYEYLQGQSARCAFCTNDRLLDVEGKPRAVVVWEFQNILNGRWYQCHDQAIEWVDGRLVRLEIAVDINQLKHTEAALEAARRDAEALARVDALTRTQNRRAFYEHMERLYSYMQRKPMPLCVAMLDIDHFKRINDRYGHAFGDSVLIGLCDYLRSGLRESDMLFRLGGEEFVIVLADCDLPAALELVERLRHGVEALAFRYAQKEVHLTCSFGLAEYQVGRNVDAILRLADAALYAAKAGGRNCSRIADGHTH